MTAPRPATSRDPEALADRRAAAAVERYARDVVVGAVVANRFVRRAAERHLRDLEDGLGRGLRWDPAAAGHAIRFFGYLRLAEGQFKGQPFVLAAWQAFIVGSLFGWYLRDEDGTFIRRFRNAYVETAKGSGKTPTAAGIGLYGLVGDTEATAEIYSAARGRDQAAILWTDARRMVEQSPALRARIEILAHALVTRDGSSFKPVSSEAGNLHGKRPHIVLVDEEHAHPDAEVIDAMRAGTKSRRNALIVRITNAGYDRHSICWQDHDYSVRVLEGVVADDAWFAFVCGLDACEEHRPDGQPVDGCAGCDAWTDEAVWPKANPNLGVTPTRRYLREMVTEATGKPASQSVVKRLNFCIWTEGTARWLDAARFVELADVDGPAPVPAGPGFGGLDLSSTTDLSAAAFLTPRASCEVPGHAGRCYDLRIRYWLPAENLADRVKRDGVPYDVWVRAAWITLTPGNRQDQAAIVRDLGELADWIRVVGVDRWNTGWLTPALQAAGFAVVEVGQGFASLSAPARRLEADIAAGLVHHDGNPVTAWMVANAVAATDAAGNLKPDKARSTERIDGVAAWLDALVAMTVAPPEPEVESAYAGLTAEEIYERLVLR